MEPLQAQYTVLLNYLGTDFEILVFCWLNGRRRVLESPWPLPTPFVNPIQQKNFDFLQNLDTDNGEVPFWLLSTCINLWFTAKAIATCILYHPLFLIVAVKIYTFDGVSVSNTMMHSIKLHIFSISSSFKELCKTNCTNWAILSGSRR